MSLAVLALFTDHLEIACEPVLVQTHSQELLSCSYQPFSRSSQLTTENMALNLYTDNKVKQTAFSFSGQILSVIKDA